MRRALLTLTLLGPLLAGLPLRAQVDADWLPGSPAENGIAVERRGRPQPDSSFVGRSTSPTSVFPGRLVVVGGGGMPDGLRQAIVEWAGGVDAPLVVIPTASGGADEADAEDTFLSPWRAADCSDVTLLHTRDRDRAASAEFLAPLRRARAVWISGGAQGRLAAAYEGTPVVGELRRLLLGGGIVGGTSAGAAIVSRHMIERSEAGAPVMARGFGLLPYCVIDQHLTQRGRLPRLEAAVRDGPQRFGIGLDERTALIVQGRRARIVGAGRAHVVLPPGREQAGVERPGRTWSVGADAVLDLPQLRRAAIARGMPAFPAADTGFTAVPPGGTLLLGGGGRLSASILRRFVAAAGGARARIVVVPTAAGFGAEAERSGAASVAALQRLGAGDVRLWHHPGADFDTAAELLEPLATATGVWFGGGRQWRLVDAYAATPAWELFRAVLRRGGAIGGSSAGATIQGEYLVRGHPLGNQVMMAEGYERGLGVLSGCAVDQHFTERGRLPDLREVVDRHPQLLGIGLDEGTAAVVVGDRLEVLGSGSVTLLDRAGTAVGEGRRERVLKAGESVQLGAR